ncbi:hypothetical protein ACIGBL_01160 [Streptomyces sp. NPDC085614]|uniref:hypothetical protein n=1 Tax=Streptomyces sp. NPDC085614 TaxID=3365733 RepID=UPI0037D474F8
MGRRSQVRSGTVGGCLFNGCLTVLGGLLLVVTVTWIWLATEPARDESTARDHLRAQVDARREEFDRAAADGDLSDVDIARILPAAKPAPGAVGVTRSGGSVTVVAGLLGHGPPRTFIFVTERTVAGCYAFDVPVPGGEGARTVVRDLPQEKCRPALPTVSPRPAVRPGGSTSPGTTGGPGTSADPGASARPGTSVGAGAG